MGNGSSGLGLAWLVLGLGGCFVVASGTPVAAVGVAVDREPAEGEPGELLSTDADAWLPGRYPRFVDDLDGDTLPDVVANGVNGFDLAWLPGSGTKAADESLGMELAPGSGLWADDSTRAVDLDMDGARELWLGVAYATTVPCSFTAVTVGGPDWQEVAKFSPVWSWAWATRTADHDVNGDGFPDLLVAWNEADDLGEQAHLFLGPLVGDLLPEEAALTVTDGDDIPYDPEAPSFTPSADNWFGRTQVMLDHDGDGIQDILLNSPSGLGSISTVAVSADTRGSLASADAPLLLDWSKFDDAISGALASVGDLDDDGFDDLVVDGIPHEDLGRVLYGPLSGDPYRQRMTTIGLGDTEAHYGELVRSAPSEGLLAASLSIGDPEAEGAPNSLSLIAWEDAAWIDGEANRVLLVRGVETGDTPDPDAGEGPFYASAYDRLRDLDGNGAPEIVWNNSVFTDGHWLSASGAW